MKLLKQTKKQVEAMVKAGYPLCIPARLGRLRYSRHCNACIKMYRKSLTKKYVRR